MKKIIYIKITQLLVIDGIMLAFLTFKEGLTWDWILIYSGWLIFFHPVLLTYLSNQLCDHFSQLYSQLDRNYGALPYKFSYGISCSFSLCCF